MQLVRKYRDTLCRWTCASDYRGSVRALGGKRWPGGCKLRPQGWAGRRQPRAFSDGFVIGVSTPKPGQLLRTTDEFVRRLSQVWGALPKESWGGTNGSGKPGW